MVDEAGVFEQAGPAAGELPRENARGRLVTEAPPWECDRRFSSAAPLSAQFLDYLTRVMRRVCWNVPASSR